MLSQSEASWKLFYMVLCMWARQLVGGQSESKKILILVGEPKATQRQAEMKDGEIGKEQGKGH